MFERRSPRLKAWDYSSPGWYYVTICTKKRAHLFGVVKNGEVVLNRFGEVVVEEWYESMLLRPYVALDEFVVMPNHVHFVIGIEDVGTQRAVSLRNGPQSFGVLSPRSLSSVVRGFKSSVTRRVNELRDERGSIWQGRFYDHIIRDEDDLNRVRQYIRENPLKWDDDEYR